MASSGDGCHPAIARMNEAVAIELIKGGHPEGKPPCNPSQRSRSSFPESDQGDALVPITSVVLPEDSMGSGGEPLAGHQPGQEMHAHMTKNETHLHQHHVSAPNIYQHSQTVNVVNTGPSTEEVAAYASARHDAIINQLQAGHVEEKGRLYQDAVNHINVCQQEAMAKEREFNEARQQWVAQRSEAEQKYERLKLIWEVNHNKQKEEADRNAAEMREIIMKQSRDIEALRHELRSRSEQSSSSNVPIFGLRPKASPVQTFPPPGLDLSSKVRVRSDSTELRRDGPGAADDLDGDAGDYEPTSPAQDPNDTGGNPPGAGKGQSGGGGEPPAGNPGDDDDHDDDDDDGDDDGKKSKKDKKKKKKKDKKKKSKKDKKKKKKSHKKRKSGSPSDSPSSSSSSSSTSSSTSSSSSEKARAIRKKLNKILGKQASAVDADHDKPRVKEAERIIVPSFPLPESYRNWRIKVREAVCAASDRPDDAFTWISRVWEPDVTIEELKDPGTFLTLDAKLLSALTNIIQGDLARQVDTFKEIEAQKRNPVRGRQVLLMVHEHLSTNIKHGATYAMEDLLNVRLVNDNLTSFMRSWEGVLAGMNAKTPDDSMLEALFYNQLKKSKQMQHHLNVYLSASEESADHSYTYLIESVRQYLSRARLERNRERVARQNGGRPAAPAAESQRVPKGFCIAFVKYGSCRRDNCTYKHEQPSGDARGRTPSRDAKPKKGKGKGRTNSPKGKKECRFYPKGRCDRGENCPFAHVDPKPAVPGSREPSADKQKKQGKDRKHRKSSRDRSKSSSRSTSRDSKGEKKKGHKGKSSGKPSPSSGKPSPAAVCVLGCLLSSMMSAPIAEGNLMSDWKHVPALPSVRFSSKVEMNRIPARGEQFKILDKPRVYAKVYPIDHQFSHDEVSIDDARLGATMLAFIVRRELEGHPTRCKYECDSDIGCDQCAPRDMGAKPALASERFSPNCSWIIDTGSGTDLFTRANCPEYAIYNSNDPVVLMTANGPSDSSKQANMAAGDLGNTDPYLLPQTPSVLSVGLKCMNQGYDFIWHAKDKPFFVKPDGTRIYLKVRDYVPYYDVWDSDSGCACPAEATIPSRPEGQVARNLPPSESSYSSSVQSVNAEEEEYTPSIAPPEEFEVNARGLDELLVNDPVEFNPNEDVAPMESKDLAGEDVVGDPDKKSPRSLAESALRQEAVSRKHLMTHQPKNPFCEVCKCAKMTKSPSRSRGGSRQVDARKFAEHITADFIITADEQELGIDDEYSALVISDVATGFKYVYPFAKRNAEATVKAFQHFTSSSDEVGTFYSDNAPELIAAAEQMGWRHVLSQEYVHKTNAVAERSIRTVLEGTRVALAQAGLNHSYWPHAARHWCLSQNVCEPPSGSRTPWNLRFEEEFKGQFLPFGCRIDYWTGPRQKPKKDLKFDPTSNPGVFVGYVIHPGFLWRGDYLVASLKELNETDFDDVVKLHRVFKITRPDGNFVFPMQDRYKSLREGKVSSNQSGPTIQDAPLLEAGQDPEAVADVEDETLLDEPAPSKVETIKTVDHKTGGLVEIPKEGSSFSEAGGFLVRKYKGTNRPPTISSFVWQSMSQKQRREAKQKYEKDKLIETLPSAADRPASSKERKAAAAEAKEQRRSEGLAGLSVKQLTELIMFSGEDPAPAMPTVKGLSQAHRHKLGFHEHMYAAVARPVNAAEIRVNPEAQKSLDVEWEKLSVKKAWDLEGIREWDHVSSEAKKTGEKAHVGRVFEICVEKGSELPKGHKLRKFKGRTVFQGNDVKDENSEAALFAELGSSPATMEAGKVVDAYGAQPGYKTEQADGKQAYTQSLMRGTKTWVRLPKTRWPKSWIGKYKDPVVPLRLALYGHPDSGGLWEIDCTYRLGVVNFVLLYPDTWPSLFYHHELQLLLIVYVDDFKMSGPEKNMKEGWRLISTQIDMDEPEPIGRYLGCKHMVRPGETLSVTDHPFADVFQHSLPDPAAKNATPARRTQDHWEYMPEHGVLACHHVQPRCKLMRLSDEVTSELGLTGKRYTEYRGCTPEGDAGELWDDVTNPKVSLPHLWQGTSYFFDTSVGDATIALAAAKRSRSKSQAKSEARAQGFFYLDQLEKDQPAMREPVTVVEYDMCSFLESCVERYVDLAGG